MRNKYDRFINSCLACAEALNNAGINADVSWSSSGVELRAAGKKMLLDGAILDSYVQNKPGVSARRVWTKFLHSIRRMELPTLPALWPGLD